MASAPIAGDLAFAGDAAWNLLALQRTVGNQAVMRLLKPSQGRGPGAATPRDPSIQRQDASAEAVSPSEAGLELPPKDSRPTADRVRQLREYLNAHVAGHALAAQTYTFYEVLDQYLGPWGSTGYPIGYGKKYNILFSTNETLMANPTGAQWVWRTTILLQESLVQFVAEKYRAGQLGGLAEPELRQAAFDSHPRAYTRGGLTMVALVAPELIPTIATIPGAEFSPTSPDFGETVEQVVVTAGMVAPEALATLLAAAAGPAHTGGLRRAADMDRRAFMARIQLSQYLGRLSSEIEGGRYESITTLEAITRQLVGREYPEQGFARAAREVVAAANRRKRLLASRFAAAIQSDPSLEPAYDRTQPGWRRWLRE